MRLVKASRILAALQKSSTSAVAPQVAGRIAALAGVDERQATLLAARLSPAQTAGLAVLPDVWPIPGTEPAAAEMDGASAVRRVLLAAALSVTDRADILLAATATDTRVVLSEPVRRSLRFAAGRYRFLSERTRSEILADADPAVTESLHRALWRAHRARGLSNPGLWHALHGTADADSRIARELVGFGERVLAAGNADAAFRIATAGVERGDAPTRARAALLGGRAALALGCFEDAIRGFEAALRSAASVTAGKTGELRSAAEQGLRAATAFVVGPEPDADPLARVAEQLPHLSAAAVTASDRAAVAAALEIADVWWTAPQDVDELHARLYLGVIPTPEPWPWNSTPGPLSPLIEAYLRGQQTGFLLHAGQPGESARVLRDALIRLPMTHIGGGVTLSAVEALHGVMPDLQLGFGEALRRVRPQRHVDYDVRRDADGESTAAASRASRAIAGPRLDILSALTEREAAVVDLLAEGLRNREIGARLGISERTIEVHLSNAFRKLGVRNRAEMLARILRDGAPPAGSA